MNLPGRYLVFTADTCPFEVQASRAMMTARGLLGAVGVVLPLRRSEGNENYIATMTFTHESKTVKLVWPQDMVPL